MHKTIRQTYSLCGTLRRLGNRHSMQACLEFVASVPNAGWYRHDRSQDAEWVLSLLHLFLRDLRHTMCIFITRGPHRVRKVPNRVWAVPYDQSHNVSSLFWRHHSKETSSSKFPTMVKLFAFLVGQAGIHGVVQKTTSPTSLQAVWDLTSFTRLIRIRPSFHIEIHVREDEAEEG